MRKLEKCPYCGCKNLKLYGKRFGYYRCESCKQYLDPDAFRPEKKPEERRKP